VVIFALNMGNLFKLFCLFILMFDMGLLEGAREKGLRDYLGGLGFRFNSDGVLEVVARQKFVDYRHLRGHPGVYRVSFKAECSDEFCDAQWWYRDFAVRDGRNVTPIARSLGIDARDKKFDVNSSEGLAVDLFLYDAAIVYAEAISEGSAKFRNEISRRSPGLKSRVYHPKCDMLVVV